MKLSFIIPLYNAEAYIGKCLDSILYSDVDRKEYEVIVIDDGSTDNGLAIARQYEQQYDNIKVLTQTNQGQSVARNYGIREAKGKYIWFVDSDDYVDATSISSVMDMMDEKNVEICKFCMDVFDKEGNHHISTIPELENKTVYSGLQLFEKNCVIGSVCNSFFLRKFIVDNKLEFFPRIIHQDSEFSIRSTALSKSILYVNSPFYIYRYNTESCTRSKNYNKLLKAHVSDAIIAHNIRLFVNESELNTTLSTYLNKFSFSLLKGRIYSYLSKKGPFQRELAKEFINKLKDLGEYPIKKTNISFREKFLVSLFNCRKLYISLVWLRQTL
ncbi:MAG: glycosyltransferase [Bacteroidaceae bacterium]|nr:glycosyltransferase [Bacteroidaceae bacterium]